MVIFDKKKDARLQKFGSPSFQIKFQDFFENMIFFLCKYTIFFENMIFLKIFTKIHYATIYKWNYFSIYIYITDFDCKP